MAIEPLNTDEKREKGRADKPDMDSMMIAGCTGFVTVSLLTFTLVVWPHFIFSSTHRIDTLITTAVVGFLPACILGAITIRRFGLPVACGYVGGTLSTAIFLLLRLKEVVVFRGDRRMPQPEFPDSWVWLVPLAECLAALFIALLSLRKEHVS